MNEIFWLLLGTLPMKFIIWPEKKLSILFYWAFLVSGISNFFSWLDFRMFMRGKFDAYVQTLAKTFQNQIVDQSIARNFTVSDTVAEISISIENKYFWGDCSILYHDITKFQEANWWNITPPIPPTPTPLFFQYQ